METAAVETPAFSRKEIRGQIIHLAWPVIGEQILTTLAGMVDAALLGHLNPIAMAAIGFTQTPHWLLTGLFMGLGVGVNALVARYYGAGQHDRIAPATRAGFWLGLLLSLLTGLLVWFGASWIVTVAGAQAEVVPVAADVLRLLAPGMVAAYWMMVMTAALRATGDTRTSLVINVGINVLNAAMAYALIYGAFGLPKLGVYGAGYATSTARILGALLLAWVLFQREEGARLEWRTLGQVDWSLVGRIVRVGYVASTERMTSTFVYIFYAILIASLGTIVSAAQNITVAAENVSWFLSSGFSMATAAMVGQRLGAGRPEQAEAVIKEATKMAVALLGVVGLCFIAFPGIYLSVFTNDPAVLSLGSAALRIAGFTEVGTALVLTLNGALSGAGDTRPLFIVTIGGGLIRLSLAYLFIKVLGLGLSGAWLAAGCDWVVRSALIWSRFRSGKWKTVKV
ncbi:MAG TPA: MATE family efflux transporter [Symbiobacteriaceae bacterium]|nr:MATE family efflux transporter [Symbiobacteriaceae bacterium]